MKSPARLGDSDGAASAAAGASSAGAGSEPGAAVGTEGACCMSDTLGDPTDSHPERRAGGHVESAH
jgi:hypothetical protein